jgi:hypothetical protein
VSLPTQDPGGTRQVSFFKAFTPQTPTTHVDKPKTSNIRRNVFVYLKKGKLLTHVDCTSLQALRLIAVHLIAVQDTGR